MVGYTTIFGPYDTLVDPPFSSIELICFTNQRGLRAKYWKLINVDIPCDSIDMQIRLARRFKILPQEYLPHSDGWIWIDANLKLRTNPARLTQFLGEHILHRIFEIDLLRHSHAVFSDGRAAIFFVQ